MADEKISWRFYGYVTPGGGCDVQEWFDSLSEDERDEARDAIGYLQVQPRRLWNKPKFEAFDADISEVRFKASIAKRAYRISYTVLSGTIASDIRIHFSWGSSRRPTTIRLASGKLGSDSVA